MRCDSVDLHNTDRCGHEALENECRGCELRGGIVCGGLISLYVVTQAFLTKVNELFSALSQDHGIEPTLASALYLHGGSASVGGHLEEAKLVINDSMPLAPNKTTRGAFLGACRSSVNVELGVLAASELLKLECKDSSACSHASVQHLHRDRQVGG